MCKPGVIPSGCFDEWVGSSRRRHCSIGKIRDLGDGRASYSIPLRDGWEFRLDTDGSTTLSDAIDGAQPVQVPHTWQSLGRSREHVGMVSYRLRFSSGGELGFAARAHRVRSGEPYVARVFEWKTRGRTVPWFREIRIRATVRNAGSQTSKASIQASIRREGNSDEALHMGPINAALKPNGEQIIELGPATVKNAALWHFDSPHLDEAAVELNSLSGRHQLIEHFGIRKFELRGPAFYLQGRRFRR